MSSICLYLYYNRARMLSLVVCGVDETTTLYYPSSSLMRVDLPTLGLPMRQILMTPLNLVLRASAPRVLENAYSGLIKNSSKFYPSKASLSAGLGLILLKSLYHCPALKPFSALTFYISVRNFFTNYSNFYYRFLRFDPKASFIYCGTLSFIWLSSSITPEPSAAEAVQGCPNPNAAASDVTSPSSNSPSHLLKTTPILAWLPKAFKYWANLISSWVTGFLESMTSRIMWDSWIAAIVCLKIYSFSELPETAPFLSRSVSTPGVSIIEINPSKTGNSLRSRVVPLCESTIAMFSPTKQLKRLLFPQLGNPTSETLYLPYPSTPLFQLLGLASNLA